MLNCCIWDINENENINKIIVDLEINNYNSILANYYVELDLNLMGLTTDDDYVEELYFDIKHFINDYYYNYNKIPTMEEIKQNIESKNWLETKIWLEGNLV